MRPVFGSIREDRAENLNVTHPSRWRRDRQSRKAGCILRGEGPYETIRLEVPRTALRSPRIMYRSGTFFALQATRRQAPDLRFP